MATLNREKYELLPVLCPDRVARFWELIDQSGTSPESQAAILAGKVSTPCHLWTAGLTSKGYGLFNWVHKSIPNANHHYHCLTHVLTEYLKTGVLPPDGYEWDHLCSLRRCCNIEHLELVTSRVNVQRGVGSSLTESKVFIMHVLYHEQYRTHQAIAIQFGITKSMVSLILSGKRWSDIFKRYHQL